VLGPAFVTDNLPISCSSGLLFTAPANLKFAPSFLCRSNVRPGSASLFAAKTFFDGTEFPGKSNSGVTFLRLADKKSGVASRPLFQHHEIYPTFLRINRSVCLRFALNNPSRASPARCGGARADYQFVGTFGRS
jgi:hypothetical protein